MSPSKRAVVLLLAAHVVAGFLFLSPSYIRPDSVAVQSWLRSIVVDRDFVFYDEWAGFRMLGEGFAYFKEVTPVDALANHWWIGTSIVTGPFYLVSHALSVLLPGELFPDDGFFGLDLATLGWTSVLFHGITMLVGLLAIRRLSAAEPDRWTAATALACASLGTPAFWYAFRMPIGTHASGMMLVGILTFICIRVATTDDEPDDGLALLAGLALGLAIATRIQHVVLVPAVLCAAIAGRRSRREWLVAAIGTTLPVLVQGAAWLAVYGTPFGPITAGANLEGVTWMPFRRLSFLPVLFSSWRGLLVWSPIWLPALAGMVMLLRDRESATSRRAGAIILLMFAGELFANGTLDRYWWGGMSFGPRRFVDLTVPVAIGLWAFLRRSGIAGRVLAWGATAWSCLLMLGATTGTINLSRYLSWSDLREGAVSAAASMTSGALRSPVTSAPLAVQSVVALAVVGGLAFVAWRTLAPRPATAVRLVLAWVAGSLIMASLAIGTTRARAADERQRFGLDTPAARAAGPLIDQRGLVSDELAWLEASGRADEADLARREIARIDDRLRELGVAP